MLRSSYFLILTCVCLWGAGSAKGQEQEPPRVDDFAYDRVTEDDLRFVSRLVERRTFRGPVIRKAGFYLGMDMVGKTPIKLETSKFYDEYTQRNDYILLPLINFDYSTKTVNTNLGFMYVPARRVKDAEIAYISGRFGQDFQLIERFWNGRGLVASYHLNYSTMQIVRYPYIDRDDLTSTFQMLNYNFDAKIGYRGEDSNLMIYAGGGMSTTDTFNTDVFWNEDLVALDQIGFAFIGVGFCGADDVICITAEYHADSDFEAFGVATIEVRR